MRMILSLMVAVALLNARAEPTVSDVVVSQRWPWNENVDVDFTLSGGAADVVVTATWDGRPDPYELGVVVEAKSGRNRLTWDPSSSPYAGRVLTGFTVATSTSSSDATRYMVIDLDDGNVSYTPRPDGTDGRWSDTCKTRKMVFRRVSAGTYSLGLTTAELNRWYGTNTADTARSLESRKRGPRTQTFSSDFYLAVFQMTEAQYDKIANGVSSDSTLPKLVSYEELRGSTNVTEGGICWPLTCHAVTSASFIGKFRALAKTDYTIDLPVEEQWEIAARSASGHVFPKGGSVSDSDARLWTIFGWGDWHAGNGGNVMKGVGLLESDNFWGFYDMLGNRLEWTLDVWKVDGYGRSTKPESSTDPVGADTWQDPSKSSGASNRAKVQAAYGQRVVRSAYNQSSSTALQSVLPSVRNGKSPQATDCTARLCIHLKPLVTP